MDTAVSAARPTSGINGLAAASTHSPRSRGWAFPALPSLLAQQQPLLAALLSRMAGSAGLQALHMEEQLLVLAAPWIEGTGGGAACAPCSCGRGQLQQLGSGGGGLRSRCAPLVAHVQQPQPLEPDVQQQRHSEMLMMLLKEQLDDLRSDPELQPQKVSAKAATALQAAYLLGSKLRPSAVPRPAAGYGS